MPIKVLDELPAAKQLEKENIFVMTQFRAAHQDIRPLKIGILNLMPTKITTETQLLRVLSNSPLQVEVDFIKTSTYRSKNTSVEHLNQFYKTFDDIKANKYDGFIITGAPVENMKFEEVEYWPELVEILDWTKTNVTSTFHICWGAQAGLYHHYGIEKYPLKEKQFGIFEHDVICSTSKLMRGFDDKFYAPHSRYTEIRQDDIEREEGLELLATSKEAGVYIVFAQEGKRVFVTGHSEYDADTLHKEYMRDVERGLDIKKPVNYYSDDIVTDTPLVTWRSHASLLFNNWLNYFVYQITPYNIEEIDIKTNNINL